MANRSKILSVVGTRPNLMKAAPVAAELERHRDRFDHVLVHTGQHYDDQMSSIFFEQLAIGQPQHTLEVGSGTHAYQTAAVMEKLEPVLLSVAPDLVVVYGDVNSTAAAAITAAKLGIKVAHIEAGLRSFDRTMPEEINRVVTDSVADLLFTTSPEAEINLSHEGHCADKVHFVGNTMIDTLLAMQEQFEQLNTASSYGFEQGKFLVVTLHRPALVDSPLLAEVITALRHVAKRLPVVFPAHPRTHKALESQSIDLNDLTMLEPLGYLEFLSLVGSAAAVLTDSGGLQEETTVLRVPCFTLRDNTERPITVEIGTNMLLGLRPEAIYELPALIDDQSAPRDQLPLWDGKAAGRIVEILALETDTVVEVVA